MSITTNISTAGAIGLSLLNTAPSVYSFLDLSGSMNHILTGSYIFTGQGIGKITISYDHDKDFQEIDINGVVIVGKIPGNNGKIEIQCQQASNANSWLGYTYNKILENENKYWAGTTMALRNTVTGRNFTGIGISFSKIPDEISQAQGELMTWILSFADGKTFVPNPSGKGQMSALQKAVKTITG